MTVQQVFEFCRPLRGSAKKPERLFFGLMPDEAGLYALGECVERFLIANAVEAVRLKPVVALQRLCGGGEAALFGAKLAGQAVAAAGLVLTFDTIATDSGRLLGLTGSDPTLTGVHQNLAGALARNGLGGDGAPVLVVARAAVRVPPEPVKLKFRVSGLALLRGEPDAFQVLRRWPLNRG